MRVGSTSGSLPPVPPNVQSVRGSDVMVDEHCGLVTCAIIQERLSLVNSRTQFTSPYHFIWNKNVHNLPRGLCGTLLYYEGRIMVIVKAQGNFALTMSVFPKHGNNVVSRETNEDVFLMLRGKRLFCITETDSCQEELCINSYRQGN